MWLRHMSYLIIANIERIDATEFIVLNAYDDAGQLADSVIKPFEGIPAAVDLIRDGMYVLNQMHFEVYTSNPKLYGSLIAIPGAAVSLKHRDQTVDTRASIEQVFDIMRELYEIQPIEPLPTLSKWRKRLFIMVQKLADKLKGAGKYEI
ncbi:hypothetical protein ACFCVU_20020 [Peribacillus butanolivorans]|uniref:hypothetical protein n=1 Tax=Peribacillus butanolivorans TaxID=421767 RepID=UPI0035DEAB4D